MPVTQWESVWLATKMSGVQVPSGTPSERDEIGKRGRPLKRSLAVKPCRFEAYRSHCSLKVHPYPADAPLGSCGIQQELKLGL